MPYNRYTCKLNAKDTDMDKVLLSCDITTKLLAKCGLLVCSAVKICAHLMPLKTISTWNEFPADSNQS